VPVDELNLNLRKFAHPFYFFFLTCFLALPYIVIFLVSTFLAQNITGPDAGLEGKI